MIAHPETDWESRRNRFNHDWLKNLFLQPLGKLLKVLDDQIEDDQFVKTFMERGLKAWEQEYPEVLSLIDSFSTNMSPRVLFERPPLSRLPTQFGWLPTLVDALWQNRVQADQLVSTAGEKATTANASYVLLKSALGADIISGSVDRLREHRDLFVQFHDDCGELARAIAKFPGRILVH